VYEVELKFPVADPAEAERRLAALAARLGTPVEQVDRFFTHPCRDFARTDEALRLRRTAAAVAITWKGPRIDPTTKTRREIELPIVAAEEPQGSGAAIDRWTELLEALGFHRFREVAKRRRHGAVSWQGRDVQIAVDEVAGLGGFLELELQAAEADVATARGCLESLAGALGCTATERRSYLELLLAREG